jgi:hypothetical protein
MFILSIGSKCVPNTVEQKATVINNNFCCFCLFSVTNFLTLYIVVSTSQEADSFKTQFCLMKSFLSRRKVLSLTILIFGDIPICGTQDCLCTSHF